MFDITEFKPIKLQDLPLIQEFLDVNHNPTSDYRPFNLFFWRKNSLDNQYTFYKNNLILKLKNPVTDEYVFTIVGSTALEETLEDVLVKVKELSILDDKFIESLRFKNKYILSRDRENDEYILDIEKITELNGSEYMYIRNRINKFMRENSNYEFKQIFLNNANVFDELENVYHYWSELHCFDLSTSLSYEKLAFSSFLKNFKHFEDTILTYGVYVDGRIEAFSIYSLSNDGLYAYKNFEKANPFKKGIYQFIQHNIAIVLRDKGVKYINLEQDLGLIGLRQSKERWHPITMIRKYRLTKPESTFESS